MACLTATKGRRFEIIRYLFAYDKSNFLDICGILPFPSNPIALSPRTCVKSLVIFLKHFGEGEGPAPLLCPASRYRSHSRPLLVCWDGGLQDGTEEVASAAQVLTGHPQPVSLKGLTQPCMELG